MDSRITLRRTIARKGWTETPTKMKNESPERDFRDTLREIAPIYGCELIAIPDTIPIKGRKIITHKKPCDDILITTHGNYMIEAKFMYNPLLPHQEETMRKVNAINQSFFVVRKIKYKAVRVMYHIEQNGEKIFKTGDIQKIFKFFQDPSEHHSQSIMLEQILPYNTKKLLNKVRV